jgi:amino acid permease
LGDQSRPWLYSGLFVLIGVLVLFFGLKLVKLIDEWLLALVVIIIVVIAVLCWPAVNPINYQTVNWSNSFIGYGVLLFALSGTNAIFSVREVLKNREKMIKPAIITGSLLPMFLYALFAVAVVGVTGSATTEIATIGLGSALGSRMIILCNLFAAITMFTSFCAIGLSLKQMYYHDYGLPAWLAWILVISVPPIIFFLVSPDFIKVIGLAGAVTFGLSGVLIVAAYWRSKKHGDKSPAFSLPKFYSIGGLIILMFVLGIIYSLVTWKA